MPAIYNREKEYDKLVEVVRNNINMDEIYRIMGLDRAGG